MIRFREKGLTTLNISLCLGLLTLTMASITALIELDAKKIVALSTLRQLGLIFVSISIGNLIVCFTHVLTHAVAKANLFLVIGNYLHSSFSNQDNRALHKGRIEHSVRLARIIRILSLRGVLFITGFYSKEQILLNSYLQINSFTRSIILLIIATLTLSYCLKLLLMLSHNLPKIRTNLYSILSSAPLLLLRTASLLTG